MPSEIQNKVKGVFGIVFSEDRASVLMVKRRDFPLWVFPGGGIEEGETPEEACIREVEEESGYKCRIRRKVCDFDHKRLFKVQASLFELEIVSGSAKVTDETQAISFFRIDSPPAHFFPLFKEFLDITLKGESETRKTVECITWKNGFKYLFKHPLISIGFLLTKLGLHFNKN